MRSNAICYSPIRCLRSFSRRGFAVQVDSVTVLKILPNDGTKPRTKVEKSIAENNIGKLDLVDRQFACFGNVRPTI